MQRVNNYIIRTVNKTIFSCAGPNISLPDFSGVISSKALDQQQPLHNGFHHDRGINEKNGPNKLEITDCENSTKIVDKDIPLVFKPMHTSSMSEDSECFSPPVSSFSPFQESQRLKSHFI